MLYFKMCSCVFLALLTNRPHFLCVCVSVCAMWFGRWWRYFGNVMWVTSGFFVHAGANAADVNLIEALQGAFAEAYAAKKPQMELALYILRAE